jgi:hypothetical protein
VAAWVGSGAAQGGVALFTNDLADNLYGATTGDPFDANLDRLFVNAATYAAATGHGYIGEFNGSVEAMAMGLLPGTANAVHGTGGSPDGHFHFDVGPIGASNPIDSGVTFPFTDLDTSLFRTDITGSPSANIVDVYDDNGLPAVLANSAVIRGGGAAAAGVPTLTEWGRGGPRPAHFARPPVARPIRFCGCGSHGRLPEHFRRAVVLFLCPPYSRW